MLRCKICKSTEIEERRSTWWYVNEDKPNVKSEAGEVQETWCPDCERETGSGSDQGFEEIEKT